MADGVPPEAPILVVTRRLPASDVAALLGAPFPDMIKFVADVERGMVAVGGHLHADAEALLIAHGSRQATLWGGNYYPARDPEECVEFESLINIRPGVNGGMEVEDPAMRARIRELVFALVGRGRPRP